MTEEQRAKLMAIASKLAKDLFSAEVSQIAFRKEVGALYITWQSTAGWSGTITLTKPVENELTAKDLAGMLKYLESKGLS